MNRILAALLMMGVANMAQTTPSKKTVHFAGGCFWCIEAAFEKVPGVIDAVSGYMDGTAPNPTYSTYAKSGHVEAVEVAYNPEIISYEKLLDVFWRNINPTDADGQFVDRGPQYRSIIFYENDAQKKEAEQSKQDLEQSKRFSKPIVTEIKKASPFYKAEPYHQNYSTNHPWRYKWYYFRSGRPSFLKKNWKQNLATHPSKSLSKKLSDAQLRKQLTPIQYKVTQKDGTEPPFKNAYWDNKTKGIYVDIVSGEPLFSSKDQYDAGTGWPSFTKPLVPENIVEKEDRSWFKTRTEVRSKKANSHLGHVFKESDTPTGLYYCINSAALRFIPVKELQKEGYVQFEKMFA